MLDVGFHFLWIFTLERSFCWAPGWENPNSEGVARTMVSFYPYLKKSLKMAVLFSRNSKYWRVSKYLSCALGWENPKVGRGRAAPGLFTIKKLRSHEKCLFSFLPIFPSTSGTGEFQDLLLGAWLRKPQIRRARAVLGLALTYGEL